MIFNNCGKSLNYRYYSFRYSADELENIKYYKYLGLIMSPHEILISLGKSSRKLHSKLSINITKRDGKPLQRKVI